MSWINVGEVFYVIAPREGSARAAEVLEELLGEVAAEEPDPALILDAARIKASHRLAYADAFAVATAERHGAPLVTGDAEILAIERPLLTVLDPRTHD